MGAVQVGKGHHFLGAAHPLGKGDGAVKVAFGNATFLGALGAVDMGKDHHFPGAAHRLQKGDRAAKGGEV